MPRRVSATVSGDGARVALSVRSAVTLSVAVAVPVGDTVTARVTLSISIAVGGTVALPVSVSGTVTLSVAVPVGDTITTRVTLSISIAVGGTVTHAEIVVMVVPGVFVSADVVEQTLQERDELALVHPLERARARAIAIRGRSLLHLCAARSRSARDSARTVRPRRWRGCDPQPRGERGDGREARK